MDTSSIKYFTQEYTEHFVHAQFDHKNGVHMLEREQTKVTIPKAKNY